MNALTSPFLECLMSDGKFKTLSVLDTIRRSSQIATIAATPRDTFSTLRFILAIVGWANKGDVQFRPDQVAADLKEHEKRFNLIDDNDPFMQDASADDTLKTPGYLLEEIPTGKNINYQYGVQKAFDGDYGICAKCCLRGMLRTPAWILMGGRGMNGSINGSSPTVYAYPIGATLKETIQLNWVKIKPTDKPSWIGETKSDPIGVLEGYTWLPRTIKLIPGEAGNCYVCGIKEHSLVWQCVFAPGRRKELTRAWSDPHTLEVYVPPNPIEDTRDRGRYFPKNVAKGLLEALTDEETNHVIAGMYRNKPATFVGVTVAAKKTKIVHEYDCRIELGAGAMSDPAKYLSLMEENGDWATEVKVFQQGTSQAQMMPVQDEPSVDTRKFIAKLQALTSDKLRLLKEGSEVIARNSKAMDLFSTIWRDSKLRGKRIPLTVAVAYAHYPVHGHMSLDISSWHEVVGGKAFEERLMKEVRERMKGRSPINWASLVEDMYQKSTVLR